MGGHILEITYIISVLLFMLGLKKLGHPQTAQKGNLQAAIGMGLAIVATLIFYTNSDGEGLGNFVWIGGGILIGAAVGWLAAKKIAMTEMPQMVSLFNGMGGACSALIGLIEFGPAINNDVLIFSVVLGSLVVGTITFSGSMIAFAKLNGNMNKDIRLPYYNILNTLFMIAIAGLVVCVLV